jgi:hypothetical protein
VTDLFLGCKTPLAEKGPVPRSAAPAATGIRVTNAAHGGKSNRIKGESVDGFGDMALCSGCSF